MTHLIYNLNREDASNYLNVSTRTLDRYIKNGRLSYKKIANRVFLSTQELDVLKNEINGVYSKQDTHVIGNYSDDNSNSPDSTNIIPINIIEEKISESIGKFNDLLIEKESKIEEKNVIIFNLQKRVLELENKLNNSIALPDYTKEKEELLIDKERIQIEKKNLKEELNKEKLFNIMLIIFVIIFMIFFVVF